MPTPKEETVANRNFPYFTLALVLPLIVSLCFFILPQFSVFELTKLEFIITGYSVLLLGFFGGIRLGSIFNIYQSKRVWIVPFFAGPALGLLILVLPFSLGLAVLAVGFGAHGAWDSYGAFKGKLPDRYAATRTLSTWLICFILILIFILDGVNKSAI